MALGCLMERMNGVDANAFPLLLPVKLPFQKRAHRQPSNRAEYLQYFFIPALLHLGVRSIL